MKAAFVVGLTVVLIAACAGTARAQTALTQGPWLDALLGSAAGSPDAGQAGPAGAPPLSPGDGSQVPQSPASGQAPRDLPRQKLDASRPPSPDRFQWGPAITQAFLFNSVQHLARLTNEMTRANLAGPFVNDWMKSASGLFDANWDDGNKFATNYIAHPAGGAVYAHIARQNSKYRGLLPGDKGYVKGVMIGMAFSAVASINFEIGPVSESSIGNVGLNNPNQQGWCDPVLTPTLGTAWMVMEDYVYKGVISKIDGRNARAFWHVVLNPARSMSNLFAGRWPWKS